MSTSFQPCSRELPHLTSLFSSYELKANNIASTFGGIWDQDVRTDVNNWIDTDTGWGQDPRRVSHVSVHSIQTSAHSSLNLNK